MTRAATRSLVLPISVLVLGACAAGTASGPAAPAGGIHANTFRDPTRGIRATLPTGWVFVAPRRFSAIQEAGAQVIEERNPELGPEAAESTRQTHILFVMANALDARSQESIAVVAEPLSDAILGLTTETYALAVQRNLQSVGYSPLGEARPASVRISGLAFRPVRVVGDLGAGSVYQSYYIRLSDDESLTIIATHRQQERGTALLEIIQSFDLEP